MLKKLRERIVVGIVGGSDLPKQKEQMGENIVHEVDYSFSENGLVAYKQGELIGKEVYHFPFLICFLLCHNVIRRLTSSISDIFILICCCDVSQFLLISAKTRSRKL